MDIDRLRARRWRSHRLGSPARTITAAAEHMFAVQAQEFWGGRWALAARTRGHPSVRDVDRAFDDGAIVRSWTMRGTIHIVPARDLAWVLSITGERQSRGAAAAHRAEGIDDAEVIRAERIARAVLGGGGRATRADLFAAFERGGVRTSGQRGYHLLTRLSTSAVICQGPVVPREGGPTREQFFVLIDEWIGTYPAPAEPLAEMFTRYIRAHGPAGARDFAWWAGLPLGMARTAAAAASDHLTVWADDGEPLYVAAGIAPRQSPHAALVQALPPFDEYYLSYVDRTAVCAPEFSKAVGPSVNGMVRPILVANGVVVGVWKHSVAVGRHADEPLPTVFDPQAAPADAVAAALARYRAFITA